MKAYIADRKKFDMWKEIAKERKVLKAGSKMRWLDIRNALGLDASLGVL
jgi:hypothetical protein